MTHDNTIIITDEDNAELQRLFMRRDELRVEWRKLLDSIHDLNEREKAILQKYIPELK